MLQIRVFFFFGSFSFKYRASHKSGSVGNYLLKYGHCLGIHDTCVYAVFDLLSPILKLSWFRIICIMYFLDLFIIKL